MAGAAPPEASPGPPSPSLLARETCRASRVGLSAGACHARLRSCDAFAKTYDDFVERTTSGGLISIVSIVAVCALVASEILAFTLRPPRELVSMDVDATALSSAAELMEVRFDIRFERAPCATLALDITDAFGERQRDARRNVLAQPIGASTGAAGTLGARCGPCHLPREAPSGARGPGESGAPRDAAAEAGQREPCCSSCEDVRAVQHASGLIGGWRAAPQCAAESQRRASRKPREASADTLPLGERQPQPRQLEGARQDSSGCRVAGTVLVERAAGQLRFSMAASDGSEWTPPDASAPARTADVSHTITLLEFAAHDGGGHGLDATHAATVRHGQAGARPDGALDGAAFVDASVGADLARIYLVTIVPTARVDGGTVVERAFQLSATEHTELAASTAGRARTWAGVTLAYELSPIAIVTNVQPRLLLDLVAACTAIVGGGITIAMAVDALVHSLGDAVETGGHGGGGMGRYVGLKQT
jgi:hypothetical protein